MPQASRPVMQNYGIHPEPDGMMDWSWATEQLTQARNYWISTTRPDGAPHVAPVWGVWLDGALYFGSDPQSRRARNLQHDPRMAMHLESGDDVVILEGRAEFLTGNIPVIKQALALYAAKYKMNPDEAPLSPPEFWVFRPQKGFTWLEKDFPRTATRWEF